ncbi:hypothetical protein [Nereida sp. MMG025]|uniref:hypothetical protein n=1 Tax=Nereida sp. MMG025 TaxID=2909981 RepID=UPI001F465F40|nr:hypothetical protein [Nereida sp. MMG025]MCF6445295.1 hypothetical protein [Nereida sp. MMG025]
MDNNSGGLTCAVGSWLVGALVGFLAFALLLVLADWMFMQAAFIGAVMFLVGGALVSWLMCRPLPAIGDVDASRAGQAPVAGDGSAVNKAAPAASAAAVGAGAAVAATAAPTAATASTQPAGIADIPPAAKEKPAPKPAAKKPAAKKPAAKKAASKAKETKAAPAAKKPAAKKTAARKPVAPDGKPELLSKPRGGAGDDLKLIKGVGPKLERELNTAGVWHFEQIAGWRKKEVEWADENLISFKGRISRDEWVKQAKILAKGGETEFSKKSK